MDGLETIRSRLAADGNHSHTSRKFQDDILSFAAANADKGNCIIEVGCWRGGLSAQLAHVAPTLGQRFVVVDLYEEALNHARAAVEMAGAKADFHLGDFKSYVDTIDSGTKPTLVFIDADHRYDAVAADIRILYSMPTLPFAAAFHDYSLRYLHSNAEMASVRVDLALKDALGPDFPHFKIGETIKPGGWIATSPAADGHYHEIGCPEGVLIHC